jgi:hypothetical protein
MATGERGGPARAANANVQLECIIASATGPHQSGKTTLRKHVFGEAAPGFVIHPRERGGCRWRRGWSTLPFCEQASASYSDFVDCGLP